MTKKPTDEDQQLFKAIVGSVKRIRTDKVHDKPVKNPYQKKRKTRNENASDEHSDVLSDYLSDHIRETVYQDTRLSFRQAGVQKRYFKQLEQGQLVVQAKLDLHGLYVEEARVALENFLREAFQQGLRVVRIIHGKGRQGSDAPPILKNLVNAWLRQYPDILAFSSCNPKDGGTGAVNVLLRAEK